MCSDAEGAKKGRGMKVYQEHVDAFRACLGAREEDRCAARQFMQMHKEVRDRERPVIVELGVNAGNSTKVFLNAIADKPDARLVSVDIRDCSAAASSDKWTFVQQDSADVAALVGKVPALRDGIDILYVDSLHTAEHVKKEVYGFYPYLNQGAVVFFDDVDSGPYMLRRRKDSVRTEVANRRIHKLLEAIFRANIGQIDYTVMYGSTGLGRFDKLAPIGETLAEPDMVVERNNRALWRALSPLLGGKPG
jgi:predicted O-methyltransferase YrrM